MALTKISGEVIQSGVNIGIVTASTINVGTSTETASQPLQVTGGAYVSGNLGIGTTNPQTKLEVNGVLGFTGSNTKIGNVSTGSSITTGSNNNFIGVGAGQSNTTGSDNIFIGQNAGNNNQTGTGNIIIGKDQQTPILNGSNQLVIGSGFRTWIHGNSSSNVGIGVTNPSSKLTVAGQFQSTANNNNITGGGQIYLNGGTGNRIDFAGVGTAAPRARNSILGRSEGTKIVLSPGVSAASHVDYAVGIETNALWYSAPSSEQQFKWYAGITTVATLFGTGELVVGSATSTGTASQRLQVTGGAYVSGRLGIGTSNPQHTVHNYSTSYPTFTADAGSNKELRLQFHTADNTANLSSIGAFPLVFQTNSIERARIDSSGNLGIGTITPLEKTHIYGTGDIKLRIETGSSGINANSALTLKTASEGTYLFQTGNAVSGGLRIYDGVADAERLRINSSGHTLPGADNTYDLGASGTRWRNIYTADLQMSNEGSQNDIDGTWGKYTIQEGENDLFLINRRTGKRYKFLLEEVK
jgi:hypothetical protein